MPKDRYSVAQVWLHWIIAGLILIQFLTGESIGHFQHKLEEGTVQVGDTGFAANWHLIMGIVVLALASARITLRLTVGVPPHVSGEPKWATKLAKYVQELLYVMIFVTPILGFIGYSLQSELALGAHLLARAILMLLILLHIAGALYQLLIAKSGSFQRMLRFK